MDELNQIINQLIAEAAPTSRETKLKGAVIGFYVSASLSDNAEFKELLLAFSKEIIKIEKINLNFDKIYKALPDIIEANAISSIDKMRKSLIIALQRGNMTEDEADVVGRFDINRLKDSLIKITEELAMVDTIKYIQKIPSLMKPTPELLAIFSKITHVLAPIGEKLTSRVIEEKSKILDRIIMLDHFRTTLESIIPTVCENILNGTYSSASSITKVPSGGVPAGASADTPAGAAVPDID
jgi:hypothetical protein